MALACPVGGRVAGVVVGLADVPPHGSTASAGDGLSRALELTAAVFGGNGEEPIVRPAGGPVDPRSANLLW